MCEEGEDRERGRAKERIEGETARGKGRGRRGKGVWDHRREGGVTEGTIIHGMAR